MTDVRARLAEMPPLNCAGCTACCEGDTIRLREEDNASRYKTQTLPDGSVALAHGPDGNCVYLRKGEGCSIHGRQPVLCRQVDCRAYLIGLTRPERRRREKCNPHFKKIFAAARRQMHGCQERA